MKDKNTNANTNKKRSLSNEIPEGLGIFIVIFFKVSHSAILKSSK